MSSTSRSLSSCSVWTSVEPTNPTAFSWSLSLFSTSSIYSRTHTDGSWSDSRPDVVQTYRSVRNRTCWKLSSYCSSCRYCCSFRWCFSKKPSNASSMSRSWPRSLDQAHNTDVEPKQPPLRRDLWLQLAPLNSVHVSSDVPLLLHIPLRRFDRFQVRQQQATFFQHFTDVVLRRHKNLTVTFAPLLRAYSGRDGEEVGQTFICRYLWVCECNRNSMALASSGSSVSESSEPKPCSTWAISFTVTAKVSMACRRIIKDREVSAHWTETTAEEAVVELPCEGRSSHSGNTPLLPWSRTPGGSHRCIAAAHPPNAASPPLKSRRTDEFGFLKSKGNCLKSFLLQASSGGSHLGWSESPGRCWRRDWGWCWTGQWDEAPKSDAGCPEMRSERTEVSR